MQAEKKTSKNNHSIKWMTLTVKVESNSGITLAMGILGHNLVVSTILNIYTVDF